jgi:hypothetical protein
MKSVRRLSLLGFPMLTLLAACLSAGLVSAQDFNRQSTARFETRSAMPTLPAVAYSFTLDGVGLKLIPPDPCSPWTWAKLVLRTLL